MSSVEPISNGSSHPPISKSSQAERNKKKKLKKKKSRERRHESSTHPSQTSNGSSHDTDSTSMDIKQEDVEIEYVTVNPLDEIDLTNPLYSDFAKVFSHFTPSATEPEESTDITTVVPDETKKKEEAPQEEEPKKMSKKEKKKMKRQSIAVLKQVVKRPDVVEAWDVTAADPNLLVFLKSYRNTVTVPRHWNQKRKYLQGKRGIEKPLFQLPEFIAATGISKIRTAIQEKDEGKKSKQRQREKMAPKMGRMDIDYRVLHDAFFRYQTKPKLTTFGDLYYEGKEFEITLKEKKPGQLSDDLKKALGMPEGAPPPWLLNMQRYGPPPSYPGLKIPGLNAAIPEGARFGYHPGGWGKPPVDEFGRPLYGDVFGNAPPEPPPEIMQPIERGHWGEMHAEEEEEVVEDAAEEQPSEDVEEQKSGIETPSGLTTPSGLVTPESIQLRKRKDEEEDSGKQLYHVLEERQVSVGNSSLFGSSSRYVVPDKMVPKSANRVDLMKSLAGDKVEVALNPSEIEDMENLDLSKRYEEALESNREVREDVSSVIAEHQKKKRKKDSKDSGSGKKRKEFKF